MNDLRKMHNTLTARLEAVRALDWPLTSSGDVPVLTLCRRTLGDAEDYLEDGQLNYARLSLRVVEKAIPLLVAMHALAVEEA